MARTVIGIDVGTNAVRAAEVEPRSRPRVVRFGQVALPPGAVHEGEVVDVEAVTEALRRLWDEVGFGSRNVRVGLASARVLLRVVPMPAMSDAEARSALQFSLADHVSLPPDDTIFDVQRIPDVEVPDSHDDGPNEDTGGRVLLAAAHREAVAPLLAAVRAANLKVAAIEPLPAALVRALSSTLPSPDGSQPVEAIVSIGAGTILVVVARAGVPLFARTISSLSASLITQRISDELAVPTEEAERLKRSLAVLAGPGSVRLELARRTAEAALKEVCEEVSDSLGYYGRQDGAVAVTRVLLTGGGMLLPGLAEELAARLRKPVQAASPFAITDLGPLGFDKFQLPRLVPVLSAPIGVALGGASKGARLDLRPKAAPRSRPSRNVVLGSAAAAVLVSLASVTYMQGRGDLTAEQEAASAVQAELAARTAQAPAPDAAEASENAEQFAAAMSAFTTATAVDLDWHTVGLELTALSDPLGIGFSSVAGTSNPLTTVVDPAAAAGTTAITVAPESASPATGEVGVPETLVGQLTLNGTAADRNSVASWLESIEASPLFADVFVANLSTVEGEAGQSWVEFSAQVQLTSTGRIDRGLPTEVTP